VDRNPMGRVLRETGFILEILARFVAMMGIGVTGLGTQSAEMLPILSFAMVSGHA